jgi:hypothetical protein
MLKYQMKASSQAMRAQRIQNGPVPAGSASPFWNRRQKGVSFQVAVPPPEGDSSNQQTLGTKPFAGANRVERHEPSKVENIDFTAGEHTFEPGANSFCALQEATG